MGGGRWVEGSRRWAVGGGRREEGGGRWAIGGGRWALGDGRWEVGEGRWAMGSGRGRREESDGVGGRRQPACGSHGPIRACYLHGQAAAEGQIAAERDSVDNVPTAAH